MESAEESKKTVTAAAIFLSRRVPPPRDDHLMDKFRLDLIEKLREDDLPFANLILGDPHDKPTPEFARILAQQGSRGLEENYSPKSFQYEWMYKSEVQAILSSLQRRRGDVYNRLTVDDVFVTNSAFGGLMMSMKTFSDVGDVFVTMAPEYFAYQPMIDGLECTKINVPLSESNNFTLDVPKLEHILLNTPRANTSPN